MRCGRSLRSERYNAKKREQHESPTSVENVLGVTASAKPGVYISLFKATKFSVNYVLELLLSAGIATFGLVLNSPAVVIGGMLVSPLMGPILATGLSLAASDIYLGIKCLVNIILSILLAVLFSAFWCGFCLSTRPPAKSWREPSLTCWTWGWPFSPVWLVLWSSAGAGTAEE